MEAMKDYVAHLDNKKRITLRGAAYQYYNVKEYGNGCIILEPRELAVPESISARTLADMDRAVSNFKAFPHFLYNCSSFFFILPERYFSCRSNQSSCISGIPIRILKFISYSF